MTAGGAEEAPEYLSRDIAALLTPIASGKALAAICALNSSKCDVIEVPQGTFAVMVESDRGRADQAATAVSSIQRDIVMVTAERHEGQVTVRRWAPGVKGEQIAPGLALDEAPAIVRDIMLGITTMEEIAAANPEMVIPGRMGRIKAFRVLRKLLQAASRIRGLAARRDARVEGRLGRLRLRLRSLERCLAVREILLRLRDVGACARQVGLGTPQHTLEVVVANAGRRGY